MHVLCLQFVLMMHALGLQKCWVNNPKQEHAQQTKCMASTAYLLDARYNRLNSAAPLQTKPCSLHTHSLAPAAALASLTVRWLLL
jgi:hypothetical protein